MFDEIKFDQVFEKYPKTRLVMQIFIIGEGSQIVSYQFEQSPDFTTRISDFVVKNVPGLKRVEKITLFGGYGGVYDVVNIDVKKP